MTKKGFFKFLILLLTIISCSSQDKVESKYSPPKVKVRSYEVAYFQKDTLRVFPGTVISKETSLITAKVTGYIKKINFKTGDIFKKGDILVEIDSKELNQKVEFATYNLQEAENGLKQAEIALEIAQSNYSKALSQYDLLEKTYIRYKNLYETESVSKHEFDEIVAKYNVAKEEKNIAHKQMSLAEEKVLQAALKRNQAKALLEEAYIFLNYTKLKAPYDGVVLEKLSDIGNIASFQGPILKVGTLENEILVNVPESFFKQVKIEDEVLIDIPSLNKSFITKVTEISPDVSRDSRTFNVKLKESAELVSGMYVLAQFKGEKVQKILIPKDFLSKRGQMEYVFVNIDNVSEMRMVKTGKVDNEFVEILSGLNPGERIVKPIDNSTLLKHLNPLEIVQ